MARIPAVTADPQDAPARARSLFLRLRRFTTKALELQAIQHSDTFPTMTDHAHFLQLTGSICYSLRQHLSRLRAARYVPNDVRNTKAQQSYSASCIV